MDADLIERLVREANATGDGQELSGDAIRRFAALIAAECAKVALAEAVDAVDSGASEDEAYNAALGHAAAAIRAKFPDEARRILAG